MREISIDFQVNDTRQSMQVLLWRLSEYLHCPIPEVCVIDLSQCRYLGPDAAAVIAAVWATRRRMGDQLSVRLPEQPPQLAAFCNYSGLSKMLAHGPAPTPDHPQSEVLPVVGFQRVSFRDPDPVVRLIKRHAHLDLEDEDYLRSSISEVIQNVVDHAQAPDGGWMCARYLSGSAEVRVAVVDLGAGILNTLRPRYPELSTSAVALRSVIEGNYTSRSQPRNRGLGISNLALHVRRMGGELSIFSGNAVALVNSSQANPDVRSLPFTCPGTSVFFALKISPHRPDPVPA